MTASNRASKLDSLHKSLKKHFKPVPDAPERSVLEHLLYACCLEDARFDQADEAFAKLQQTYFDWNEVRVTTISELVQCLHSLPQANHAAQRIKQCLQSLFESRYQYEIDDLKKANLGKAVAELEAWKGMSPFVVSYVSQQALGGHSIPISNVIADALIQCEIINSAEADKKSVPGVERAIPKNKGIEFGSLLQQFALDMQSHPKSQPVQGVLKDLGVSYKSKPKVEPRKVEPPPSSSAKKSEPKKPGLEPVKSDKMPPKSGEKKQVATKPATTPTTKATSTKKMAPPASKEKQPIAGKSSPVTNKAENRPQSAKKQVPKKPEKKDSKSKPIQKPKQAPKMMDSKKKKGVDAKTKNRSESHKSKSSSGSVSSHLTKKKPK
jgi:endonuclease III